MYSYTSTLALPCRGCGGDIKDIDTVQAFHGRRFHERCWKCGKCKKPFPMLPEGAPGLPKVVREMPYCDQCFPAVNKEVYFSRLHFFCCQSQHMSVCLSVCLHVYCNVDIVSVH